MKTDKKTSLKAKKAAVKTRLANRKATIKGKLKGAAVIAMLLALCGCALERADPAARSNRTTYGAISVVVSGANSYCTLTIGDGTIASADGEGSITQPSTQTTEQSPDVTVPGDVVSAGIQAVGHVAGKAIDAYSAKKAAEGKDCKDCAAGKDCKNCTTGECTDCADGECTDCNVK